MARYLALDWDQNQIHLVAATIRGGKVKMEQAVLWQMDGTPPSGDPEAFGKQLRDRLRSTGISPAPVLVSLTRDRVILKDIRFPSVPESEEPNVVRFQTVKELTDAADDVIIEYANVTERGAPEQRALALVARKEVVESYQKLCQAAGLRLLAVTPRPCGTAIAARKAMSVGGALTPPPEPADASIAIVTVNDKWAEFCVLRGETLLLARTLVIGPALAAEIRRNVTVFNGQSPQTPVQAIYLSAGIEAALRQRLGELLDVPIYPFDPFAGAEIEVPGAPGGFSGAVGLLYAQAERGRQPVNFIEPRKAIAPSNPNNVRVLVGAAVLMVAIVAFFISGRFVLANFEKDVRAAEDEKVKLEKAINSQKEFGKRAKGLTDWGLPVPLDEQYELTRRITDLTVLRITSVTMAPTPREVKLAQTYSTKMTVQGIFLDMDRGPAKLEELLDAFRSDKNKQEINYYLVEKKVVEDAKFQFSVLIKKRPPNEYTRPIDVD